MARVEQPQKFSEFSLALHDRLPRGVNSCWSPYSVASALALAATTTAGSTRAELLALLGTADLAEIQRPLAQAASLGTHDNATLATANTLWADQRIPLNAAFQQDFEELPGAAVRSIDFADAPEQARQRINADIAETTRDLIPELLPSGSVQSDTLAALVNALYVKTNWTQQFQEKATTDLPFHRPGGTQRVPTMRNTQFFGYARHAGWQAVTLYASGGVEGVVLLPDPGSDPANALDRAEPELSPALLGELVERTTTTRVDLQLPRFKVRGQFQLQRTLDELGVRELFTPAADFSQLSSVPLRVSTVVHEGVLTVDEHGLEGAAATAMIMPMGAIVSPPQAIEVKVDRPFLFLVRHRKTGLLYFLARVVEP